MNEMTMIKRLRNKINDIRIQASSQGRNLTRTEAGLISEMENELAELEPLKPVTLQGLSHSNSGAFNSFGEYLKAVVKAETPGNQADQRLFAAASGLNETTPSDGGFLVQSDFSTALLDSVYRESVIAPRCNRFTVGGNANGITLPAVDETSRATGSRWGGVQGYWLDEAAEKTASKPKFRSMELKLKKVAGLCYATDELLQDSLVLEKVVTQAFTEELSFMLDDAIINGSGAGQPLGILNSGALVSVAEEDGQAPATICYENVLNMFSRMPGRNRKNAIWLINQSIEPQLYSMSLAIGTGGSAVFLPGGGASEAPYATLFGRPVIPIEQASSLGTLGDIMLCDMSQYVLAEKGGIKTDMSIHIRFDFDESVFRFVYRVDGQPAWSAPLTPADGGDDLSPFVALAAR